MLGKKLKEMRGDLTQTYVAKKIGLVSAQYVSNCERDKNLPSPKLVRYLCKVSKTPLASVVDIVMVEKRRAYMR